MELFLKWLSCVCSISFIEMSSSKFQSNMEIHWNACILNEYALHMYSVSLPECIYECKLRPGCSSINYNVRNRRCEINDNSWSLHTETCTGTLFSKRSDWKEVKISYGPIIFSN